MEHIEDQWFYDDPASYSSLDSMVSVDLSVPDYSGLPPILEEEWGGWGEETLTQLDSQSRPEQTSVSIAAEIAVDEAAPSQMLKELTNLQDQVQQLRRDIEELQVILSQKLDGMERTVMAAQRYVNDLVPWSMDVHESYSKLLEVLEGPDRSLSATIVQEA